MNLTRLYLRQPTVWLLDEPTASMDEGLEQRILAMLRKSIAPTQTMVLVTHKPALLGLVNRLVILTPNGIVMDGPRDAVLNKLRSNSPAIPQTAVGGGAPQ